jgi:hypothetical protein
LCVGFIWIYLFRFSIDRQSDPGRHFIINATTGRITLRKPLDRETQEVHTVTVRAIDKGKAYDTDFGHFIFFLISQVA